MFWDLTVFVFEAYLLFSYMTMIFIMSKVVKPPTLWGFLVKVGIFLSAPLSLPFFFFKVRGGRNGH